MFGRCLIPVLALIACCLLQLSAVAAEPDQELAARTALGEAEKLTELARPGDALAVLEKLLSEYADTAMTPWAQLRRSQALMDLQRYDDAISAARAITQNEHHRGTVLACWAQCVVGESMVRRGQSSAGLVELFKVPDMLPNEGDNGPLDTARGIIGRVYDDLLKARSLSDANITVALGIADSDTQTKAKVLAILAAYRGAVGRIDLANPILRRLASECPTESRALDWAATQVALGYLQSSGAKGDFSGLAAGTLDRLCTSSDLGEHVLARIHLGLARYYERSGDLTSAVAVLTRAKDQHLSSASADEVLYRLGQLLHRQGRTSEATAAFLRVADDMPLSGYAAPALYCAGIYQTNDRAAAVSALTRLAEGKYSLRWRANAYRHLAGLTGHDDRPRAIEYYTKAVEVLRQCLAEDKADIQSDWQQRLTDQVAQMESEIQTLRSQAQEVSK